MAQRKFPRLRLKIGGNKIGSPAVYDCLGTSGRKSEPERIYGEVGSLRSFGAATINGI